MTEDERYEIAVLAEAYHDARERFRALEQMNRPTDPDKARQATVDLEIARVELTEAFSLLQRAQMKVGKTAP